MTLKGEKVKVVLGGVLRDRFRDEVTYKEHKPEIQFLTVPGFSKVKYQFIVEGKGDIQLSYNSRHGGKLSKTLNLK